MVSARHEGEPAIKAAASGRLLVCLAVVQVLLRFDDEQHWLRAAPKRAGHLWVRTQLANFHVHGGLLRIGCAARF